MQYASSHQLALVSPLTRAYFIMCKLYAADSPVSTEMMPSAVDKGSYYEDCYYQSEYYIQTGTRENLIVPPPCLQTRYNVTLYIIHGSIHAISVLQLTCK